MSHQWNVSKFDATPSSAVRVNERKLVSDSRAYSHDVGTGKCINAMSVDVEDYFQVFSAAGVKGTFFTLGWIATRFPDMTRRIVDEGHELASHGWEHVRVVNHTRAQFSEDVRRTKELLEDITGAQVKGYRAASYSINASNTWAHDVLVEQGYLYSSSIAPIKHDLYGIPDAPRFAHERGNHGILEIPVSTVMIGKRNVPCGGGGWFRLYPYALSRWAISQVNERERESCVFYFHPWEIDPGQPRMAGLDRKTRFRHYVNLARTQRKIESLLSDFSWGRMDDIYLGHELPECSGVEASMTQSLKSG